MRFEGFIKLTHGYINSNLPLQITKNVIDHQVNTYIEHQGQDPQSLTDMQRKNFEQEMIEENYPGIEYRRNI